MPIFKEKTKGKNASEEILFTRLFIFLGSGNFFLSYGRMVLCCISICACNHMKYLLFDPRKLPGMYSED
jgi:hypothetical protein